MSPLKTPVNETTSSDVLFQNFVWNPKSFTIIQLYTYLYNHSLNKYFPITVIKHYNILNFNNKIDRFYFNTKYENRYMIRYIIQKDNQYFFN